MRWSCVAVLAVLAGLAASLGCQREPSPEEGEDCFMYQPPGDTSAWPKRSLAVGTLGGDALVAWLDGDSLVAELGFQGAFMLTPMFEIPADPTDGDEACWFVRVSTGEPSRPVETSSGLYPGGLLFERHGDQMRAGPLFLIVDEGAIGTEQRIDVAVFGPEFEAVHSVTVSLE